MHQSWYTWKLMDEALFNDTFNNLFCLTLLRSISFATKWWMIVSALANRLSTSPVFSLKILYKNECYCSFPVLVRQR